MNSRVIIFRRLIAKYWQPWTLLGSAVTAILNLLKLAQDAGVEIPIEKIPAVGHIVGTTQGDTILRVVIFVSIFILIRFPGIAIFITRIILGRPEAPANPPRLFRGPRPYDEEDFGKLPGRQQEIDDCLIDIRSKPFYILEGESGCGKSSILNAALLPEVFGKFKVVKCQVAEDPFGKLLSALQNRAYSQIGKAAIKPEAILDAVADAGRGLQDQSDQANLLLVCIDQFEELFVTVPDKVRAQFIKTMKNAIATGGMRLVIAIRSDFRDLLDKVCREIDPQGTVLDLSSYYPLKSFNRKQAKDIINEILKPFYQDDPVLQQESRTFANSLVDELLRPPLDRRLNPNDEKKVLPVELQIIGFMLESAGMQNFSAKKLRKIGGKFGLMREYIENAKNHVWHKTGVAGKESLLILRHLISLAPIKGAQSPRAIGKAMKLPEAQVDHVLQSFAEKYLVKRLPGVGQKDDTGREQDGLFYELMHEYLIQILIEAPDPVLQKARDAKERLRFWVERASPLFAETYKMSLPSKFASFLKMPIPLIESVKLWRFADQRDERYLLKINIRGFLVRLLLLVLPLSGWTVWTYTDSYQIKRIISDAPVVETAAGDSSDDSLSIIENYFTILVKLAKTQQALTAALDISSAFRRCRALVKIVTELAKSGQTQQTNSAFTKILAAFRDIPNASYRFDTLNSIFRELVKAGQTQQALAAARDISDAEQRYRALENIATGLAKTGQTQQALTVARDISYAEERYSALENIATELAKTGQTQQTNSALSEALAAARDIRDAQYRSIALMHIATEFAKSGQTQQTNSALTKLLAAVRDIPNLSYRFDALENIATEFAKSGQTQQALAAARDISSDSMTRRSRALNIIATVLAKSGQTHQALAVARDIPDASYRFDALKSIFREFAKTGQTQQANGAFSEALAAAREISDAHGLAEALRYIATELAKTGHTQQALAVAREISYMGYRSEALVDIATELAKSGQTQLALTTARDRQITTPDSWSALKQIATELAKSGQTQLALTTAREIPEAYLRYSALVNIATELVKTGQTQQVNGAFSEALAAARNIGNAQKRHSTLVDIAKELAKTGHIQQANLAFTEALAAARDIPKAYLRYSALLNIATELVKTGQTQQALTVARDISYGYSALENIAKELAKSGQTQQALTVAHDIRNPQARLNALISIASKSATANETELAVRSLEEALSISREIDNIVNRSKMLAIIAVHFAQIQNFRKARLLANEGIVPEAKLVAYTAILQTYYDMKYSRPREEETARVDFTKTIRKLN